MNNTHSDPMVKLSTVNTSSLPIVNETHSTETPTRNASNESVNATTNAVTVEVPFIHTTKLVTNSSIYITMAQELANNVTTQNDDTTTLLITVQNSSLEVENSTAILNTTLESQAVELATLPTTTLIAGTEYVTQVSLNQTTLAKSTEPEQTSSTLMMITKTIESLIVLSTNETIINV